MDIIVTAKCDVPARVRAEALDRVEKATRFFDRLIGVEVVFGSEANPRIAEPACVEVTGRTKGHHIRAEGRAGDHRSAVDVAVTRFERQLARYKARIIDRERRRQHRSAAPVAAPGIPTGTYRSGSQQPRPAPVTSGPGDRTARIVRRKRFELAPMLPEDAAVQLELLGHEFFVFTNSATGACNVVYRRTDGDLGLIEPA